MGVGDLHPTKAGKWGGAKRKTPLIPYVDCGLLSGEKLP